MQPPTGFETGTEIEEICISGAQILYMQMVYMDSQSCVAYAGSGLCQKSKAEADTPWLVRQSRCVASD